MAFDEHCCIPTSCTGAPTALYNVVPKQSYIHMYTYQCYNNISAINKVNKTKYRPLLIYINIIALCDIYIYTYTYAHILCNIYVFYLYTQYWLLFNCN